ncbi:uncharacterized protein CBL_13596 [Carabus blaptoides fortunei]
MFKNILLLVRVNKVLFNTNMNINRGALIVLEGCDRSGKSTQCKKLVASLREQNILVEMMSFPDRTTATGKLITDYLLKKIELNDRTIHLLFSSNRWELALKMEEKLHSGITLIIDRYAYSGVAYSAIKSKMELDWCKQSDVGLPKPDLVFLLTLSSEALAKRPGYGDERYEQIITQQLVAEMYLKLADDCWKIIDADECTQYNQRSSK